MNSESQPIYYNIWKSPLGFMLVISNAKHLLFLEFGESENFETQIAKISQVYGIPLKKESSTIIKNTTKELAEFFAGKRRAFSIPLKPTSTPFQLKVWQALQQVPFGETRTYLEQSKMLGNKKAIRAVASANGKNPIAILIPCHRIIGSNGSLTGYAGGLWRKKWLLEHEQKYSGKSFQGQLNL